MKNVSILLSVALLGVFSLVSNQALSGDGVLSMRTLSSNEDIVTANAKYLYALNFGFNINDIKIENTNGSVTFYTAPTGATAAIGVATGTGDTDRQVYSYLNLGTGNPALHDGKGGVSGVSDSLASLLTGFIYGQTNNRLSLSGLDIGQTYTMTMYSTNWGGGGAGRDATFLFDSQLDGNYDTFKLATSGDSVSSYLISQNNPTNTWAGGSNGSYALNQPYAIDYTFVADANTLNVLINSADGANTWHFYSASLYAHTDIPRNVPTSPVISNASFEADNPVTPGTSAAHTVHGYATDAFMGNQISGWTITGRTGVNPGWGNYTDKFTDGATPVCTDFTGGKTIPDGKQAAFIQSSPGIFDSAISQEIDGFEVGKYYTVNFSAAARGAAAASMRLNIGDLQYRETVKGDFQDYSHTFLATDTTMTLTFGNRTMADTSLLLDAISVTPIATPEYLPVKQLYYSDNFSVLDKSASLNDRANDAPGRFGGSLGALEYVTRTPPEGFDAYAVGDFNRGGALRMAGYNGATSQAALQINQDFNEIFDASAGGLIWQLDFRVQPLNETDRPEGINSTADWAGVIVGDTAGTGSWVNNSAGIGMLIRNNGQIQIFDGSPMVVNNMNVSTLISDDGWYDISIDYWINDSSNLDLAMLNFYINDVLVHSEETDSFDSNYFTFLNYTGGQVADNLTYSYFDDIAIWGAGMQAVDGGGVPEPATLVLLALGMICLAMRRVFGKKNYQPPA